LVVHSNYRDVLLFDKKSGEVYIKNKSKLKDVFIEEYISNEEQSTIKHKTIDKIVGENVRSTIRENGMRHNVYTLIESQNGGGKKGE